VPIVSLLSLISNREGSSTTKFDTLIEPRFGECVAEDRKIVVGHFELLVCDIQGMPQVQELYNSGSGDHRAMTEPCEGGMYL
jgi:hypothetical protein